MRVKLSLTLILLMFWFTALFAVEFRRPYREGNSIVFSVNDPENQIKHVYLAGNFNFWRAEDIQLKKDVLGRVYRVKLRMAPGRYEYKYVVNGGWRQDTSNPLASYDGYGTANSVIYVLTNGKLDWDRDEHFVTWESLGGLEREQVRTKLDGFYRVEGLTLEFTNLELILTQGYARLVESPKGPIGMVFYGEADVKSVNDDNDRAQSAYISFAPPVFQEIKPGLTSADERRYRQEWLECNNAYSLLRYRYYSLKKKAVVPPPHFVGLSLLDEGYTNERNYLTYGRVYLPVAELMRGLQEKSISKIPETDPTVIRPVTEFIRDLEGAFQSKSTEGIQESLVPFLDTRFTQNVFKLSVYDDMDIEENKAQIFKIKINNNDDKYFQTHTPLLIEAPYTTKYRSGIINILLVWFHGQWRILAFQF